MNDESSPLKRLSKRHGRTKPYTVAGIRRLSCVRCGKPAEYQWQACADGLWRPICPDCDVALNAVVLRFMRDPEAEKKIEKYKETLHVDC